jgi:hypothetical protein
MAPSKAARSGQDDPKTDAATSKEKNGGGGGSKMRRVASSAGSNLREVTNASAPTNAAAATASDTAANTQEASTPGVGSFSVHCILFHFLIDTFNAFANVFAPNSCNGPPSTGTFSTHTVAHTASRRRPPSSAITTNGSSLSQEALGSTRRQSQDAKSFGGRPRTS